MGTQLTGLPDINLRSLTLSSSTRADIAESLIPFAGGVSSSLALERVNW